MQKKSLLDVTLKTVEYFISLHPKKELFKVEVPNPTTQYNIYVQIQDKKPFLNINIPFSGDPGSPYIFYDKSSSMVADYGAMMGIEPDNITNRLNWLCSVTELPELNLVNLTNTQVQVQHV